MELHVSATTSGTSSLGSRRRTSKHGICCWSPRTPFRHGCLSRSSHGAHIWVCLGGTPGSRRRTMMSSYRRRRSGGYQQTDLLELEPTKPRQTCKTPKRVGGEKAGGRFPPDS